jgi:hypothetical protein
MATPKATPAAKPAASATLDAQTKILEEHANAQTAALKKYIDEALDNHTNKMVKQQRDAIVIENGDMLVRLAELKVQMETLQALIADKKKVPKKALETPAIVEAPKFPAEAAAWFKQNFAKDESFRAEWTQDAVKATIEADPKYHAKKSELLKQQHAAAAVLAVIRKDKGFPKVKEAYDKAKAAFEAQSVQQVAGDRSDNEGF